MVETRLWINGYLVLGRGYMVEMQDCTVNQTRDLKEDYGAGSTKANILIPGQEKIDFTIKRVFSEITMQEVYRNKCMFDMLLFNNSNNPGGTGESVCVVKGCVLSQNNLGGFASGETVTEDIQGKALDIEWNVKEIESYVQKNCVV